MTPSQQLIDAAAEAYEAALVKDAANPYVPALEAAVTVALREAVRVAENGVHQECCMNHGYGSPPECCGNPNVIPMYPNEIAAAITALIPKEPRT